MANEKNEKKEKRVNINSYTVDLDELLEDNDLVESIKDKALAKVSDKTAEKYDSLDVKVEIESHWCDIEYGYDGGDYEYIKVTVDGIRLETDKEFEKRINNAKKSAERRKKLKEKATAKDKKELERLAKKYGKTVVDAS